MKVAHIALELMVNIAVSPVDLYYKAFGEGTILFSGALALRMQLKV